MNLEIIQPNVNFVDKVMNRIYASKHPSLIVNLFDYLDEKHTKYKSQECGTNFVNNSAIEMGSSLSNHDDQTHTATSYNETNASYSIGSSHLYESNLDYGQCSSTYIGDQIPPYYGEGTATHIEDPYPTSIGQKTGFPNRAIQITSPSTTISTHSNSSISNRREEKQTLNLSKLFHHEHFDFELRKVEKNYQNHQFYFYFKTNQDMIEEIESNVPYLSILTPKRIIQTKLELSLVHEGCSWCGRKIIEIEIKTENISLSEEEIKMLRFEFPKIDVINVERKNLKIKDDFSNIPIRKPLEKKIIKFEQEFIKVDESSQELKMKELTITDSEYILELYFKTHKNLNESVLLPKAILEINDNTYNASKISTQKEIEKCEKCGDHILGYQFLIKFDRKENMNEIKLSIPYLILEEYDLMDWK